MNPLERDNPAKLWSVSFICLTLGSFLLFLNLQMLLSSFPAFVKNKFAAGDFTVSLVTSVFALSAIATRFLTAALLRKVHRNMLLFLGLALAVIVTAIYILANSIQSLLVMRVAYGIGFGMASTIIPTLVSQIIPPKRMGEGIGYFGLSTSLAMSVGPMIGLNVMKQYGFNTLAVLGAVVAFLIFPVIVLSRSIPPLHRPSNPAPEAGSETSKAAGASVFTKLLFPALLNVLLSVTYSGLLSFIALFGQSVHLEQVGLFFLFNAITIILIRPISGKLFDKRGQGAVLIPAAACVVASMLVLSFTHSIPMLIVSALLYGLGFGAIQPTLQAWMLRLTPKEQHGTANSMFYNSTDLGVALGALILGGISSLTGYSVMYRYSSGFMLLFLIVFVLVHMGTSRQSKARARMQQTS